MAKQEQMQAPSGMAGLVRYFEEDESILKLKPDQVLAICGGLVVIEIAMLFLVPL
jgi:preprotein translocase subunit Sec61beta